MAGIPTQKHSFFCFACHGYWLPPIRRNSICAERELYGWESLISGGTLYTYAMTKADAYTVTGFETIHMACNIATWVPISTCFGTEF